MRYSLVPMCLVCLLTATFALRGQDAKGDLEKLQGDWAVAAMERDEKSAPKEVTDNLLITFKADTMTMSRFKGGAKGKVYTIKLDPAKKPGAIDLLPVEGKAKGTTVRGIYQLEGKNLKLCISNTSENERPSDFKAPKGSDLIVLTLVQAKK